MGDELNEPAQPEETHRQQQDSRHPSRQQQSRESLPDQDGRENDDERRRRPGHLEPGPAEEGAGDARDDGGVEPMLRRDADGDGQGHRERQRDDAHHQACQRVVTEIGGRIAFGENGPERGSGKLTERECLRMRVARASHLPTRS